MTLSLRKSLPFFCLLLPLPIFGILVGSTEFLQRADILSLGITVDLVFVIPFLYYLLIRNRKIPKTTVVPIFILGVICATFILPEGNQYYLSLVKTWLVPLVEFTVVGFVIFKVRQMIISHRHNSNSADLDFYSALSQTCEEIFPSLAAKAVTMEVSIFYYGFFHWETSIEKENAFSYHRESSARIVLGILILLVVTETLVFHILIMNWSMVAAWILTGLSVYSGLQVFGILRSLAVRPHLVQRDSLDLRFGILNQCAVNFDDLATIEKSSRELEEGTFSNLSPLGSMDPHNVIIEFKTEQTISGLYGREQKTSLLTIHVDRPDDFVAAVRSKMKNH
ncbi:hypothetical protein ACFOSV_07640 [Algoriphagus namhaensis]|uniref:Beta-carotene 15,15'-monooxygenase n=1 Tax=Algoriphagus namhaensis TaxID=915353 RepID=A0ABV8AQW6_9BACT